MNSIMAEPEDQEPSIEETQAAFHDAIERTREMAAETRRRLTELVTLDPSAPAN